MDLEKVIQGMTVCSSGSRSCKGCPYEVDGHICNDKLKEEALVALKELRLQITMQKCAEAGKEITEGITEAATAMSEEIAAQEQAIETLHLINAKLEGKVEAYENMLQRLVHERP